MANDRYGYEHENEGYAEYEAGRELSVNRQGQSRRQSYKKKKVKLNLNFKNLLIMALIVAMLSAGVHAAIDVAKPYFDGSYQNVEYNLGSQNLHEYTYRTADNQGYWYNVGYIAEGYEEGQDLDSYIYGVYSAMDTNRMKNMNDFIRSLHGLGYVEESSFVQYCFNRGFIKTVDGQEIADVKAYQSWAKDHIRALNNLEDILQELGSYEDVDADSYVFRLYEKAGWDKESKISVMDLFMARFGSTFEEYLESKGFVTEKDGKKTPDYKAYEKAAKQYIATLSNMEEEQKLVDGFRQGR